MTAGVRPAAEFWAGKRVLITGHTGFKGGWLALWLHRLGAILHGYALAPPTDPSFFALCGIGDIIADERADVRDAARLAAAIARFQPDIVFHLAAQALVRAGYAAPLATFEVNVMGTLNLLAAVRATASVTAAIIVTSDKVYAESAGPAGLAEDARLGGRDPYSASKACAELATAGFPIGEQCRVATVRAGNVIGGGDFAADRLLPDFLRAIAARKVLQLRHPGAIRPWQHVLDPLCGYLLAAQAIAGAPGLLTAWNFGPGAASEVTVQALAARFQALWGADARYAIAAPEAAPEAAPHEAPVLRLDAGKAARELGWQPAWPLDDALARTVAWFQAHAQGVAMKSFSLAQIEAY